MNRKFHQSTGWVSKTLQPTFSRRLVIAALGCVTVSVQAQPTGLLYDPEPPPDSGYVRVMSLASAPKVAVAVNGKPRIPSLLKHQVSEYLVVPAGKHQIDLSAAGKVIASVGVDVGRSSATTVVLSSGSTPAHVFVDKTGTNKLKSMLSVYHLAEKHETLDVTTGDGTTKVFSNLAYGTVGALQVNPITVDLIAVKPGTSTALARAPLSMTQGGAYSVFLLPALNPSVTAVVTQNKIERYTGR